MIFRIHSLLYGCRFVNLCSKFSLLHRCRSGKLFGYLFLFYACHFNRIIRSLFHFTTCCLSSFFRNLFRFYTGYLSSFFGGLFRLCSRSFLLFLFQSGCLNGGIAALPSLSTIARAQHLAGIVAGFRERRIEILISHGYDSENEQRDGQIMQNILRHAPVR